MADAKVVEKKVIEFGSWYESDSKNNAVDDSFYDTLLDKVNAASKKAQGTNVNKDTTPISKDKEVSSTLKKTIKDVFEGEDYGVDFADSYALLDEKDKAEFENIILGFIEILEKEIANEDYSGSMQSFLDRLFPPETTEGVDPYADVKKMLLELQEEGKTSAEDLLSKLVPMLLEASAKVPETPDYEYGKVSVEDDEMTLEDMLEAMQEIASIMAKIDAGLMENPDVNPEENPEGEVPEIPEISDGTETPETPEISDGTETPEVPETPEISDGTETPEVPETPEISDGTETPEVPETPGISDGTETPGISDGTETPEISDETETPEVSDEEEVPETTEEPETPEVTEEHLESPAEMVDLLSRNGFSTTSTGFTRSTTELEEIAVSSVSTSNISQFGNIANFDEATMMSVQRQVISAAETVMGRLTVNSSDEINLVLNPENLGRISVRLTNQGGDIIIRIAAESEETQAILRDRLPSLMQSLTEINNSVREITVEEISQSAEMQANLMFGNGGNSQQGTQENSYNGNEAVEEISETTTEDAMKGVSRLWQKA